MPFIKTAVCLAVISLLAAPSIARSTGGLHWEKLHLFHAEPSQVFTKLGLTHIVRNGYTRGMKKGTPDPTFPPGLTDVVPYDAGHSLLVRGTAAGVATFRQRVAAADVPALHWRLSVTLLRQEGNGYRVLAGQDKEIVEDTPLTVVFDMDGRDPRYQVRVRVISDGSLAVSTQAALPLAPPTGTTTVLSPAQVWTAAVTKDTRPGDMLTFDDLAADRAAARQRLGQPPGNSSDDYQVQVQLTSEPAAPSPGLLSTGGPTQ